MSQSQGYIDVKRLIASRTVAEHNALAEAYFGKLDDWTYHLGKPFSAFDETHPPFGAQPPPQFLTFDGHTLPLPDESVERIICLDAFHHVPNPEEVLAEMSRVLVAGGRAGFAEPGPEHSRSETSQYEMRQHSVIENDVDLPALWKAAQRAGFTNLKVAAFNQNAQYLSLDDFNDLLDGGATARAYLEQTRRFLSDKRNFFFYKGASGPRDSRFRAGLKAEIIPLTKFVWARAGETIAVHAVIKNTSTAVWLPPEAGLGAVYLGFHVKHQNGEVFRQSYHWQALTLDGGRAVQAGESVTVAAQLPALPSGRYLLELDLVSNDVCWFALNGSPVAEVEVEVLA